MTKGFPTDSTALLDEGATICLEKPTKKQKMQTRLNGAAVTYRRERLRQMTDPSVKENISPGQTVLIMTHTQLLCIRSQATRSLQAPLFYKGNRISRLPFIFYIRYLMTLPRLIRHGRPTVPRQPVPPADLVKSNVNDGGWNHEVCALNHGCPGVLSECGAHEISCPSTFGARYGTHTRITRVVAKFAVEAGATVHFEPPTRTILKNQFTETECRSLCPKTTSCANRARSAALASTLNNLATMRAGPARDSTMHTLGVALASLPNETKGVRLDLAIEFPELSDILCDFTGIHPTTKGVQGQLLRFLKAQDLGEDVSAGVVANNPLAREPSPAVAIATRLKRLRYLTLMEILGTQVAGNRRQSMPKLVPGVVTHMGELGPDFIGLIETVTGQAGLRFKKGPMSRGLSKARFTAVFRTRFKDNLLAVNAEGFGQALVAAGNPISGWVVAPDDCVWDGEAPSWISSY
jgi:hypothetical protein